MICHELIAAPVFEIEMLPHFTGMPGVTGMAVPDRGFDGADQKSIDAVPPVWLNCRPTDDGTTATAVITTNDDTAATRTLDIVPTLEPKVRNAGEGRPFIGGRLRSIASMGKGDYTMRKSTFPLFSLVGRLPLFPLVGRALCGVLAVAAIAIAATGRLGDPTLARWLLIGTGPALGSAMVWPMLERRGLHIMRFGNEHVGTAATAVSYVFGIAVMEIVGDVVCAGYDQVCLVLLLAIPAMLSLLVVEARKNGWIATQGC